jgi:ABC-type nitrate/sulfonate/bicarbonate transport system substrate-binding protein
MSRPLKRSKHAPPLRLGFLPENDCAPAVVAHEFAFFEQHGLKVELHRESSCASLRDKLIHGALDAAIAPATLPFVLSLGLDFEQCPCVSGLMVSLQGNALTVSRRLWEKGVRDAASLRDRIFKDWGRHTYTFGVVFPYSPQYFLLGAWLRAAGIVPHSQVRIVVVPPEQMFPTLELGYLDGFCVGEPWTSVAVEAGQGVCLTTSVQLSPLHPEKALMVRGSFAAGHAEEHEHLIAALVEAGRFCEQAGNWEPLCELLARPEYVNAPVECIRSGLIGPFRATDRRIENLHGLNVFSAHQANEPSGRKTAWVTNHLWNYLHLKRAEAPGVQRPDYIFRRDLYLDALKRVRETPTLKGATRRETATPATCCVNA